VATLPAAWTVDDAAVDEQLAGRTGKAYDALLYGSYLFAPCSHGRMLNWSPSLRVITNAVSRDLKTLVTKSATATTSPTATTARKVPGCSSCTYQGDGSVVDATGSACLPENVKPDPNALANPPPCPHDNGPAVTEQQFVAACDQKLNGEDQSCRCVMQTVEAQNMALPTALSKLENDTLDAPPFRWVSSCQAEQENR
jgi:hypothetical protein